MSSRGRKRASTDNVVNRTGNVVQLVAYPAGRGAVVLLQLAPFGSGQVKALQGDLVRAIEPASNSVLGEFTAGRGTMVIGNYPANGAAPSYGYPPAPGMSGGWGPPPPQNNGWAQQAPRAPPPTSSAPTAAPAAVDDGASAGTAAAGSLKARIQGMLQRLRSQSRSLTDLVETESQQLKETLRTIAVAASAAAKQPKRPADKKKKGNDLVSNVADIPGQATFETRWRAFVDNVRGRLKSMKLLSKEMSVNMIMGQMDPEEHRGMSAELALMMDGIREALQLVDQCRISATVAPPPAAAGGCCSAGGQEEEPRELVYTLIDDISIQAYLSDIRQNFNVKDLNLGNMKIALGSDLGGTYTVGGQTNFSYDTSSENHIDRSTPAPAATAKTPLMADADDDPYGNSDPYGGGDQYGGGGGNQAGSRPPDYDQKVNA